jgi:hypothetical protein
MIHWRLVEYQHELLSSSGWTSHAFNALRTRTYNAVMSLAELGSRREAAFTITITIHFNVWDSLDETINALKDFRHINPYLLSW